jgi:chemotaxis protein methyltransferase WspC
MKNLTVRKRHSLNQLREAAENCEVLPHHRPSARVFHLLGLLHDCAGDPFHAGEFYRKALHLAPDHYDGLFRLALLEEKSGRRAAVKLLKNPLKRGRAVSSAQKRGTGRRSRCGYG